MIRAAIVLCKIQLTKCHQFKKQVSVVFTLTLPLVCKKKMQNINDIPHPDRLIALVN